MDQMANVDLITLKECPAFLKNEPTHEYCSSKYPKAPMSWLERRSVA
jgi:hypothetical protein